MGLGASSLKWEPHILCYEKHFRVLAIDNRGSGLSAKPECEAYSIADMAADVIGLLDALASSAPTSTASPWATQSRSIWRSTIRSA